MKTRLKYNYPDNKESVGNVLRLRRNSHVLAYGILGKGGLFVAPPLEDCLTGLTGSSTRAETGCTDLQLNSSSVADCQTLT